MTRRFYFAILMGAALIPVAFSGCFIRNFGYSFDYAGSQSSRTETGDISANCQSIEIINRWGNISVQEVTSADATATWTWTGTTWGSTADDADVYLAELDMIVTEENQSIKFEVVYPKPSQELRGIKSHLTLQIPQGASINIKNRHGESIAKGISGTTTIKNSHGDVSLTDMMGPVNVSNNHAKTVAKNLLADSEFESDHGSVSITSAEQSVKVVNDHGSIRIHDARGRVTTNNDHGSTTIETSTKTSELTSQSSVSVKSDHGSIKILIGSDQVRSIFAENDHGGISIKLPNSASPKLDLSADHGSERSEFQHDPNGKLNIKCRVDHGSIKILKTK